MEAPVSFGGGYMITQERIHQLAYDVVYITDKRWDYAFEKYMPRPGYKGPNPEAFGAGGYECYDPDDLVFLIEKAIRKALEENK